MRARAGLAFVRSDGAEEAVGVRVEEVPDFLVAPRLLDSGGERRRHVHHRHGVAEQDHGLVALGRGGVDLRALLAIGNQAIQTDPTDQRRLARAFARLDIRQAEPAKAFLGVPAEQAAHDECLPGCEQERRAFVVAAVEAQHVFEEPYRPIGLFLSPLQAAGRPQRQVVQVTLASVAHIRASDNRAGQHRVRERLYPAVS